MTLITYQYGDKLYTLKELAMKFNKPEDLIRSRLNSGWPVDRAVEVELSSVTAHIAIDIEKDNGEMFSYDLVVTEKTADRLISIMEAAAETDS